MGSDLLAVVALEVHKLFQSTLPVWGATYKVTVLVYLALLISIHAPRVGSDAGQLPGEGGKEISIHAPRVGSDFALNPMSPGSFISIHAPRVGSDLK